MISTLVYSFPLNFMILYIQQNWIFILICMTCTSNVHNFSLNFHNLVHSSTFHWIFKILHIQWIRIFRQIRIISSSKVHNFPWISTILYFQWNQFSQQVRNICASNVLNFHDLVHSSIFYWIFTKFYIQQIWIFLQIQTICTFNVHNFPLNFHNFVLSM